MPAAAPAFDARTAYVPLRDGTLAAVSLERSTVVWRVPVPVTAGIAAADNRVFAVADAVLVGIDAATGRELWRTPLAADALRPFVFDDRVVVGSRAGELAAFDGNAGHLIWRAPLSAALSAPPALQNGMLFVGLEDGQVVALDRTTGAVRWSVPLGARVTALAAAADQALAGTAANRLSSLSLSRGQIRWTWRVGADVVGIHAAGPGLLHAVALDNTLRAFDRRSGNLRWSRPLPSRPMAPPTMWGDRIYVPLVSNELAGFAADTGTPAPVVRAGADLAVAPFLSDESHPARTRVVIVTRQGAVQGLAERMEPAPAVLDALPGARVGG